MTITARVDPRMEVVVHRQRALHYASEAEAHDDRPPHVRAASGLAFHGGRLVVAQDDAAFLAIVASDGVSALKLPRGLHGRRRFEVAIGNKLDKLDLESMVAIDDALWAFGSGSLPMRDKLCIVRDGVARVRDAAPLYNKLRVANGGAINLEGVARVGDELWLFHRGNTGAADLGPAVLRIPFCELAEWIAARGPLPSTIGCDRYDLGSVDGHRLGFTDAVAAGTAVLYLAAAEATDNAIDDGRVLASQVGVIDLATGATRTTPLLVDGLPAKAEGIALDPAGTRAWIALDPDDPDTPAALLEVELRGPWLG